MGDKYIDDFDNIDDNLKGSSLFLMYSDCDTVNASLSAITAYINTLSPDISITGGTYDQNTGVATFTNNSGGTFSVSGFLTGYTDTIISAFTYNNANQFTIDSTNGSSFSANINILTGLTINGLLSATTYNGYTPANDSSVVHTSGTESISGLKTFFNITNFFNPLDSSKKTSIAPSSITLFKGSEFNSEFRADNISDVHVLQVPDSSGTLALTNSVLNLTGGTVTGPTRFTNGLKANTFSATTYQNLPLDKYVTGGTYSNGTATFRNNNGGTFNVNGFISSAYSTIQDEGVSLTQQPIINFVGAGVTASNGSGKTVITIPGTIPTTNYGLFAQTGNSTPVINGTEGTLIDGGMGTLSVPANGFSVGDSFRADFGGLMSCRNNETLTIRVKAGSTVLSVSPAFQLPGITNQVWLLTITFTIRAIGPAGTASIVVLANLHVLKQASGVQEGFGWNTIKSTEFDTTISNTLNVTAQWGSSHPLDNSIYSDIFILNKIY